MGDAIIYYEVGVANVFEPPEFEEKKFDRFLQNSCQYTAMLDSRLVSAVTQPKMVKWVTKTGKCNNFHLVIAYFFRKITVALLQTRVFTLS